MRSLWRGIGRRSGGSRPACRSPTVRGAQTGFPVINPACWRYALLSAGNPSRILVGLVENSLVQFDLLRDKRNSFDLLGELGHRRSHPLLLDGRELAVCL